MFKKLSELNPNDPNHQFLFFNVVFLKTNTLGPFILSYPPSLENTQPLWLPVLHLKIHSAGVVSIHMLISFHASNKCVRADIVLMEDNIRSC